MQRERTEGPRKAPHIAWSPDVAERRGKPRTCRHVSARGRREGAAAASACKGGAFLPGSSPGAPRLQQKELPSPAPGDRLQVGLRKGASSGTLPRDTRPHCCGASRGSRAGEGGCGGCCCWAWGWGCCSGRPLIPCPILECYSVTYNRVTRAASDVPNASIGHRNKEGRVPGSELYNPEFRDALIGSEVPGWEGRGVGGAAGPREI